MSDSIHQDITDIFNNKFVPDVGIYLKSQPEFGVGEAVMIFFPDDQRAREWIADRTPPPEFPMSWDVLTSDSVARIANRTPLSPIASQLRMACLIMQAHNPGVLRRYLHRFSLDLVDEHGTPCV